MFLYICTWQILIIYCLGNCSLINCFNFYAKISQFRWMILAVYITNMQTLRRIKKENLFSSMTPKFTAWIGLQKIRIHWNLWFIFKIQTIFAKNTIADIWLGSDEIANLDCEKSHWFGKYELFDLNNHCKIQVSSQFSLSLVNNAVPNAMQIWKFY